MTTPSLCEACRLRQPGAKHVSARVQGPNGLAMADIDYSPATGNPAAHCPFDATLQQLGKNPVGFPATVCPRINEAITGTITPIGKRRSQRPRI